MEGGEGPWEKCVREVLDMCEASEKMPSPASAAS